MGQRVELGQCCAISSAWGRPHWICPSVCDGMSGSIGRALRKMPTEQEAGWPDSLTGKSEHLMGIKPGLEANTNDSLGSSATNLWDWSTSCFGVTWDVLSRDVRQSVACTMSSRNRHVDTVTFLKQEWHLSLKNSGNYIYHYALTFKNCTLLTQGVYLLCLFTLYESKNKRGLYS
jgi:hypothetical protein